MEANEHIPKYLRQSVHVSDIFADISADQTDDGFFFAYLYTIMYILSLSCETSPLSLSFICWFVSLKDWYEMVIKTW